MRICCVMPQMTAGGAERVMSELCNHWADAGHDVALLSFADAGSDFYRLRASIKRVSLGGRRSREGTRLSAREHWARARSLRRAIAGFRPDVVLSFIHTTNVLTLLATRGLGIPVVVSERAYPPLDPIGPVRGLLRRMAYRSASALVMQTEAGAAWARRLNGSKRIEVISNPLSERFVTADPAHDASRELAVVGMGRLHRQKGFDILIRAFAAVAPGLPEWRLRIYGVGDEEQNLRQLAGQLAPDRVEFPGTVRDPERVLRSASVFALSSRYEGFPNVLLEAMASGCAVVATACRTGPDELIRNGVDGLLVPVDDDVALGAALRQLMEQPELRQRLGSAAPSVRSRFTREIILAQWTSVLLSVSRGSQGPTGAAPTP
jgi:GalNAc-alpha-(1->4)-GalNAc-alpha-(1->3)-diNAcBac-PP-undecaprenol alpha-1,4-N-acetyl-D-galactosaminyltransferase